MEPRERRLEAILELVTDRAPAGVSRDEIYRRIMPKEHVAMRTVREDLQDLELRGLVVFRVGHVYVTARGRKKRLEGFS